MPQVLNPGRLDVKPMFWASQRSPNLYKSHLTLLTGARGWNCPSQTKELHLSHYYKKMEAQKKGGSSLKPMAKAKAPTMSRNSCCHCANTSLPRNSSRTKGMIY